MQCFGHFSYDAADDKYRSKGKVLDGATTIKDIKRIADEMVPEGGWLTSVTLNFED